MSNRLFIVCIAVTIASVVYFVWAITADAALTSKQKVQKSTTVVAWYEGKGEWTRRLRYAKCKQIRSDSAAGRCYRHRVNYRWHKSRIARLSPKPRIKYLSAWLCIHSGEGAWNANTGNGYYGGLQMDWSFMRTYGPELLARKGTADNWTPLEQMIVAERAHRTRGFYPWPNTARKCGLI